MLGRYPKIVIFKVYIVNAYQNMHACFHEFVVVKEGCVGVNTFRKDQSLH